MQCLVSTNCSNLAREKSKEYSKNKLANAGSPYLREHADNPVNWYEWGPEAIAKAKAENKPLIVSIGYASCHWCHVMEEESFMDTAVARIMNENFVAIKVDREERPDVDQIYLTAAQLISGNGGWPLNAFALPDGKPFYAATYFAKDDWKKILEKIIDAYKKENVNVIKQAEALTQGIHAQELFTSPADSTRSLDKKFYHSIFNQWSSSLDGFSGGIKGSPKFPMPVIWEFLLQYHYLTKNDSALQFVTTTLDNMAQGGIYDQLGGGFSRYATDSRWKVPHFEKMLYDNAQLVSLYAHAYQIAKKPLYLKVIRETLGFVQREITSPDGGFYSSINADSEGEEGKFYVWRKKEIENVLDRKASELLIDYYHITDSGNWENGKNIFYSDVAVDVFLKRHNLTLTEWQSILQPGHNKLMAERTKRVRPSTDDKILTSWNALMLTGYIDAYLATADQRYLKVALKNAQFLETKMMQKDGSLWRNYKDDKASIEAFLDDYGLLASAFIRLYEVTFDIHWLEHARKLCDYTIQHFRDQKSGMFYYTSDLSKDLVVRKMEVSDNVIPSSNAVMADVLFRLGEYYQIQSYTSMSQDMLRQVSKDIPSGPFYGKWAKLNGLVTYAPFEIAIVGEKSVEKNIQLQQHYNPIAIFLGGDKENLPLLENKNVKGQTTIYVCRNRACRLPVKDVNTALQQIKLN